MFVLQPIWMEIISHFEFVNLSFRVNIYQWTKWQHSKECMCRLQNIAMHDFQESVTTGQTHGRTNAGQSYPYVPLCFAGDTKICIQLRNECPFFGVHCIWIGVWDKQIASTAKRFSGNLFVLRSDSFPMNQEKKKLVPYIYNISIKDIL